MSLLVFLIISRLEMAELAGSPGIEGVAITTNPNTAYGLMKQQGQGGRIELDYEVMTGVPTPDPYYSIPSPPTTHQPLPAIPRPVAPPTSSSVSVAEEAEGVYEIIPGDK